MSLNAWAAQTKRRVFEQLGKSQEPEGLFDREVWRDADAKGTPQIGTTVYEPNLVKFEYPYKLDEGPPIVLTVSVEPPERIVFLPVPEWVMLNIWHGEALGSFQFESDAERMVRDFGALLEQERNAEVFGQDPRPMGRA